MALPFVITPHDGHEWLLLIGLGFLGAVVQMSLTGALRLAPVSVVIPMDYSSLLWAIAAGWWFFGTLPADTTWVGAPLIIASGRSEGRRVGKGWVRTCRSRWWPDP